MTEGSLLNSPRPPQVNGQNVVKVGHRQVVNMIRQGGNSLMVKVVMVTRNPDMEEGSRKKSKRPPSGQGLWFRFCLVH